MEKHLSDSPIRFAEYLGPAKPTCMPAIGRAHFDSFSGLVPCRILTAWSDLTTRATMARIRFLRHDRSPYAPGEEYITHWRDVVDPVRQGIHIHCRTHKLTDLKLA